MARLCNIGNVLNKRKGDSSSKKSPRRKRRKKSGTSSWSGSSSSSSINDSDTDSDVMESLGVRRLSCTSAPLPEDEDELLADALCEKMSGDSSDVGSGASDDEKTGKKDKKSQDNDSKIKKEPLSKEELEKRSWRKDALLHSNVDTDSDNNDKRSANKAKINERITRRFKKFKAKRNLSSDTDSDVTNVQSQDVRNLQRNKNKPKNKKSSATDTDSEIEFVISPRTPSKWSPTKSVINISEDEAFETTPTKGKGRRNIRALVSDENLAESTQRAQAEENERIARLEERRKFSQILSQSFGSQLEPEEGDCLVLDLDKENLKPLIKVHSQITKKLKPHQKEGVQFMWESCYESVEQLKKGSLGSGCILAHCMGLGKTLQALALIHTIFSYDDITKTKHVLVVCPLSTVPNWKNEYNLAYGKIKDCKIPLYLISSDKTSSRKYETVRRWYRNGGMLVLGYEAFGNMTDDAKLDKHSPLFKEDILAALVDPGPDLVICDEGHLLRNKSSRRTLSLNKIKAKRRIVLTGTPLQNNLLEYYHMVNFVKPNLLGTEREYKTNFVNPITNGQYEDSTAGDIRLMKFRTHILHRKLKKTVQRVEDTELKLYLPKLVDYGVFIQLHKVQVDFYKTYLDLALTRVDKNRKTFLSDVQILKYIGSHPYVLRAAMQYKNKKIKEEDVIDDNDKVDESLISNEGWWKSLMPKDVSDVLDYGNKFSVVMSLIEECERAGDKMLIFSQNYAEMDSLEHFLKIMNPSKWRKKTDYYRMDGTVPAEDRTDMCDKFNDKRNKKLRLFIMSTKVGGLGLNLTGANRVIIMNVNWNPSYDTQSVFRTFRFGQDKEVFVYRLISMDTMEEKIYQRQVTKLAIAHRVVDKHQITRHYNSTDIMELYSVEPNADEERPLPNLPEDKVLAKVLQKHNFVFRWHEHQQLLANHPEEDLNEAEKNAAWEEFNRKANEPPITIFPQIPFTQNLPGMQRAGFVMASMLANNPNMTVPGNSTFIPGMIASSSSVVNINDVINQTRMKMNNAKGLESPSSEDHDYCLPNAAVASRTQWNTSSVSAKPPAATVSTQPAANKPKTPVRKLIFNPDNNTVLPNPLSNLHRNITKLINKTPVPGTPSVLYSTSQGVVTISHTTTSGITATSTTPSISTIARPNVSSAAAVTPKVTQLPNAPNMTLINTPTIPSAHRASSNAIYYPRAMTSATVQPNYSGLPSTRPKPTAVNRSNVNNKRPGPNKVNINPAALPNYGVISATTARNSKPTTGLNTISTVKRDQGKPTIAVNTNNLNNKTHVPNKVNALPPPPLVMYHNPTSELNRLPLPLSYSKPSSELNKLPTPLSNTKPSSEPNKLRSPLSNSKPNSKRKKLPHPLSNSKPTDLNRLPPLVYPNPNNLTSDVSKSNMEKDPLFIHPKLVGATPHIDKPYKEAVLLIEKLNARKTANEKQVNGALVPKGLPTQKSLALTKFQIHPGASVSDIRRQTSNTSPKTIPARTIGLKANSAPTSTSIKKLPSGVELTKLHELTKKRSNKENKKVPRSLINLADDDVTVIAPGSNEMIPNISRMKEISINKVNKKPKNVIRLD